MPENSSAAGTPRLVRVAPGALVIGKPLPWTVYDSQGGILLTQGYVIQTEHQLEQLYERGMFLPPRTEDPDEVVEEPEEEGERNPFQDYRVLLKTLERTLDAIANGDPKARLKLLGLARLIDRICRQAPEPTLALVQLYSVEPVAIEQALFYAILCHFTARELDMDERKTVVLIAAALTANLALMPILERLNASEQSLTDQQRGIIHRHPLLAVQALQDAGIDNRLLLAIVRQHHERSDGSGYPEGLSGRDVLPEATILALAEHYVALISRRGYRPTSTISEAQSALRAASHHSPRPELFNALLGALTPYPPGALVRLGNGEVAVVTHRPTLLADHQVRAILNPEGAPLTPPVPRDAGLPDSGIQGLEALDMAPPMDFQALWDYQQESTPWPASE